MKDVESSLEGEEDGKGGQKGYGTQDTGVGVVSTGEQGQYYKYTPKWT